jgi:rhodanese-related sulfurtransferase
MSTITPIELQDLLNQSALPFLLDVRGPDEFAFCALVGAVNIPLDQLPDRLAEVPRDRPIITICHHGVRSARAAETLRQNGFDEVRSLVGGVEAWALQIDPGFPRY